MAWLDLRGGQGGGRSRATAGRLRLAILPPIAAVALLRASPAGFAVTALLVAAAVVWTCGQGWWLYRRGGLPIALDMAVLLGLCTTVYWTDAVAVPNFGCLRLLVTFACATWQWHTTLVVGAAAATVASVAMIGIFVTASLPVNAGQLWMLVMAAISRAAWLLVTRAAGAGRPDGRRGRTGPPGGRGGGGRAGRGARAGELAARHAATTPLTVGQVSDFYASAQADAVTEAGGTVAAVGADLHSRFVSDPTLFSADHFHTSPAGYAVIADLAQA